MSTKLLTQLMGDFRGETLSRVASGLGETTAKTEIALSSALPALLGGLAHKISTSEEANSLLAVIRRNELDSGQYANAASAMTTPDGVTNLMKVGRPLLDSVFGGRTDSMTDWLSSFAGINRSASSSLLSLALPVVLGLIARRVSSEGWSASSLMNVLAGQRTLLQDAPAGLTSALGLGEATASARMVGTDETGASRPPVVGSYEAATPVAAPPREPAFVRAYEPQRRNGVAWWKWAPPLLLIPLLAYLFLRRDEPRREVAIQPAPAPRADVAPATATVPAAPLVAALGEFVERRLPNDFTLRIPLKGVESKLIAFIEDPNQQVDKETWFSFDRLEFETASATLRPTSLEQLRNVAEILKAYPHVNVKVGGYTDDVGDDASNLKLSEDRAVNTMNEVTRLGIAQSRLEAEGYGEPFPVADNATEEGRQRNRRIDIRVTKK